MALDKEITIAYLENGQELTKELTWYKAKTGGKMVGGFYKDESGKSFLVKIPSEGVGDIFAEAFAGKILAVFKNKKLISPEYAELLVCADIAHTSAGYISIQPEIPSFIPAYKVINTGGLFTDDRSSLFEALHTVKSKLLGSKSPYVELIKGKETMGLSVALLFSMMLGDYSVHSGNVFAIQPDPSVPYYKYGKLDWGAAFRNYANPKNKVDRAVECEGATYKAIFKAYSENYSWIPGLFEVVGEKASDFLSQLGQDEETRKESLKMFLLEAIESIPTNFLSEKQREELSKTMCISSAKEAFCGNKAGDLLFAHDLTQVMFERISRIIALESYGKPVEGEDLYKSKQRKKSTETMPSEPINPIPVSQVKLELDSPVKIKEFPSTEEFKSKIINLERDLQEKRDEEKRHLDEIKRLEEENATLREHGKNLRVKEKEFIEGKKEDQRWINALRTDLDKAEQKVNQQREELEQVAEQLVLRQKQVDAAQDDNIQLKNELERQRLSNERLHEENQTRIKNQDELIQALASTKEIQYGIILNKLEILTTNYKKRLENAEQGAVQAEKLGALEKLSANLMDKNKPLPSQRLIAFYETLKECDNKLRAHRDPSWSRYIKNAMTMLAILVTGIIPGLVVLKVQRGNLSFWKTEGDKVMDECIELNPDKIKP